MVWRNVWWCGGGERVWCGVMCVAPVVLLSCCCRVVAAACFCRVAAAVCFCRCVFLPLCCCRCVLYYHAMLVLMNCWLS